MPDGQLIGVAALADRLDDPAIRVADCRWYLGDGERGRAAYKAGHIPGAIFIDLEHHLSASSGPGRHPLPDRSAFARTMGELGVGSHYMLVAYDDGGGGGVAARLWWMMRNVGHAAVRGLDGGSTVARRWLDGGSTVARRWLDGGLTAWAEAGLRVDVELSAHRAARMEVSPPLTRSITRSDLHAALGSLTVLDARGPARYQSVEEPIDTAGGHIPTAANMPYEDNLTPDLTFLTPTELRSRYNELGAGSDRGTVVYCGSGVTACHDVLAMILAGLPEPMLYPGSWSDRSATNMPVATGPNRGERPAV